MALYDVLVDVDFKDGAGRTATVEYCLRQQYDTTANTGNGNMATVLSAADDLHDQLALANFGQITGYRVSVAIDPGDAAPNIASNNQIAAFTRVVRADGEKDGFQVPAWDDDLYTQDDNNIISDVAYVAVAQAIADLIKDRKSGSNFTTASWSQSRTRKSRGKKLS